MVWHTEELDCGLPLGWDARIASQPLCPREPKVRSLRPRQDHQRRCGAALAKWTLCLPHLDVLIMQKPHAGSPMLSPAPILPEERRTSDGEEMEEDTDLARLCGGVTIPLALLAQRTGTTTADAGSIHPRDAQRVSGRA
jgi:hypothetical protein